jgi:CelD/BcsL family acetyltransferase involved in cellulose biosynthesis
MVPSLSALPVDAWDSLWQADPDAHVYLSLPWLTAWERHYAPGQLRLLLAETAAGKLVGALPLYVARRWHAGRVRGRLLTMAGSCSPAYPLDMQPLLAPDFAEQTMAALANALAAQQGADAILFELYAAGSRAEQLLQRVAQTLNRPQLCHSVEFSHLVQLAPTYEAFLESLGARTRRNVRAYAKKFYEAGPQNTLESAETPEAFRALLQAMAAQKARRFAELGQTSNFDEARLTAFLDDALPALHAAGLLTGLMALVDGRIGATQLYLHDAHGHAYSYNSSFDPDFKELRLHYLLETERFRRAIDAGYPMMDLSTGHGEHKQHWTGGRQRELFEGAVLLTLRGRLVHRLGEWARQWKARRAAAASAEAPATASTEATPPATEKESG